MPDSAEPVTQPKKSRRAPISDLLGAEFRSWDEAASAVIMGYSAKREFENGAGAIQGGIITAMLDNAMSIALLKKTAFGYAIPTLELKTSYFRPASVGTLVGEGRVVHQGRSIAFLEGKLTDEAGTVLATASATVRLTPLAPRPG